MQIPNTPSRPSAPPRRPAGTRLAPWLLAALLTPTPALAAETLDALIATALEQNPQLTAIAAQIAALEHKTRQAGAWQNPKLQVSYQNAPVDSLAFGVEPMTMVAIRIEQTLPWPGKNRDREGVVRKTAEAKHWELEEKRNELRSLVATAYYRLALARQLHALTNDHVSLVEQLVDAVRIKYEVGRAAQENLLRLEVLRDRLKDDLEDFARQESELSATINTTLHRDAETPIDTPATLTLAAPTQTLDELRSMAREGRPALKQLDLTAQMHRAAADLAEFEAVGDPTLFASYGIRTELQNGNPGRDLVTFGVGLPLPVFYGARNEAQASESRELGRAVDASRDALLDSIAGSVAQALAAWQRADGKAKTYRDRLVPDAHRTLDATYASYQVDRADFLSLFEAELDLLNFEKTIRVATAEGLIARAVIEKSIGRTLP